MVWTQGQGARATVRYLCPKAYQAGITPGLSLRQAKVRSPTLQSLTWTQDSAQRCTHYLSRLIDALHEHAAYIDFLGLGMLRLQPPVMYGSTLGEEQEELRFMRRVLGCEELSSMYTSPRIAIADGAIAAMVATQDVSVRWRRVPLGEDASFLARLPIERLPFDSALLALLQELGVTHVHQLQALQPRELEDRFGKAGRRAWEFAWGRGGGSRSLPEQSKEHLEVFWPLLDGCRELAPLRFALRPALAELVKLAQHRGVLLGRIEVSLGLQHGPPLTFDIQSQRACCDVEVLFQLALHGLSGVQQGARSSAPHHIIEAITLRAMEAVKRVDEQADMFDLHARSDAKIEATLVHLMRRLGAAAVTVPLLHDERCPERSGVWVPFGTSTAHPHGASPINSGMRLLDPPLVISCAPGQRPSQIVTAQWSAMIRAWHGPERLSGHWWTQGYDRDYYWASTTQGQTLWIYRDREEKKWVLQGWLD